VQLGATTTKPGGKPRVAVWCGWCCNPCRGCVESLATATRMPLLGCGTLTNQLGVNTTNPSTTHTPEQGECVCALPSSRTRNTNQSVSPRWRQLGPHTQRTTPGACTEFHKQAEQCNVYQQEEQQKHTPLSATSLTCKYSHKSSTTPFTDTHPTGQQPPHTRTQKVPTSTCNNIATTYTNPHLQSLHLFTWPQRLPFPNSGAQFVLGLPRLATLAHSALDSWPCVLQELELEDSRAYSCCATEHVRPTPLESLKSLKSLT
jgi:hypothetical protein